MSDALILGAINRLLDGERMLPEPIMNLRACIRLGESARDRAKKGGASPQIVSALNDWVLHAKRAIAAVPCSACGITQLCSTCGEPAPDPVIVQCDSCDSERRYYQLQRWREAAEIGRVTVQELCRPRWWERLLRRQRALPGALDEAIKRALELEGER